MKSTLMIMVLGTLLFGACSTSDTTSKMYGRDEFNGAEARVNRDNTISDDVYRGNIESSGVIERRDISRESPDFSTDTYTGANTNDNSVNYVERIPDVNSSTGTGTGTGISTSPLDNDGGVRR